MIEIKLTQTQYALLMEAVTNYKDAERPDGGEYQSAALSALCAYLSSCRVERKIKYIVSPTALFPVSSLLGDPDRIERKRQKSENI